MNSLKNIACSNLADQILLVGKRIGNDDDAVAKVYDHFGDLPYSLAQDLWNDCLDKEDLQTAHVAILLHPNMTTLDLEEHTSPDHYFDLAKLIEWAGHKMKELMVLRLPGGISVNSAIGNRLCYSLPNIQVLSLARADLSDEFFRSLSVNCPYLASLNISKCYRSAASGISILCSKQSLVRNSLKRLDASDVPLPVEVGIAVLQSFLKLERFKSDLCILNIIHRMCMLDTQKTMRQRFFIKKLRIGRKRCLGFLPADKCLSGLQIATVVCPNVTHLSWKCSSFDPCSMIDSKALRLISRFSELKSLSLTACLSERERGVCLADVLSLVSSLDSKLTKLKISRFAHLRPITRTAPFRFERLLKFSYEGYKQVDLQYPPPGLWKLFLSDCLRLEKIVVISCPHFDDEALSLLTRSPYMKCVNLDTCEAVSKNGVLNLRRTCCSPDLNHITLYHCSQLYDDDFDDDVCVTVIY